MKKVYSIFAILLSLFLFSCSNEDSLKDVNQEKINFVLKSDDPDEQRLTYILLSPEEKYAAWQEHFSQIILENTDLTTEQIGLIESVKAEVSLEIFKDEISDAKVAFQNIFVPDFLNTAQQNFNREQINRFFYYIGNPKVELGMGSADAKSCDCNKGSIFGCASSNDCTSRKCDGKESGCGFLYLWECNGLCYWYS